ncbi:MAG: sodium:proton antiporter [Pseudomonadales bacterium]|jgi:CPA1 family monovalent cation:H+ antiporter|nr:sodium:proton antiporter [Pseudomonadales bacterium]
MSELIELLGLFAAALILASLARRVGAPYPVFLALGGALLALLPEAPSFAIPPDLVLALFLAPVLLVAAYGTSIRDLRDNWAPVTSLVVGAVVLTALGVALLLRALVPDMPWAAAIALGAIVAPPDAVSATAVLRPLHPPQRILTILEGESLLNDASALLIYRLAVGAVAAGGFSLGTVAPAFLVGVAGSFVAGPAFGWAVAQLWARIHHVPTSIVVQFVTTFSVWILAEASGLSAVLTMVAYAMTMARLTPDTIPARVRLPTYAVWETTVFAMNILAFIFIGLQLRPILAELAFEERRLYVITGVSVLVAVIVLRILWYMFCNACFRWRERREGFHLPRPMLQASVGGGLVISWSGMRGIVSLATALVLPDGFPYRDLIVFVAFAVVLGTLGIQGFTIKPLLRWIKLHDEDPVGHEVSVARERALHAALATFASDGSALAESIRQELTAHFAGENADEEGDKIRSLRHAHSDIHGGALHAARQAILVMRANDEIGEDAFHQLEVELDWLDMANNSPRS